MWIAIGLIALLLLAWALVHVYRWPLFTAAVNAQRRKGGLARRSVSVDGHDVAYLEGGSGEPLVLLHGFGANKDNWIQIAPLLSPHFRLVIPDLPGFGESTRDPASHYGADEQVRRLAAFLDELHLDSVHLGGNSMGAYIAGLFGARHPDRVKSLWLLAPAGVMAAEASEYFQCLERGENPLLVNDTADFARLVDLCFNKAPYVPRAFQRCLAERNMSERAFNEKVFSDMFDEPLPLEDALAACVVRTQIVWGDNDRILHVSGAAILGQTLHRAETVVMERMGHCPMLERPAETAARYLEFHRAEAA